MGGENEENEGRRRRRKGRRSSNQLEEEEEEGKGILSILSLLIRKMLFCCCWPISKCAQVLAFLDTIIVAYFCYNSFNVLLDTLNNVHWTTIISFCFFTGFFICHLIGAIFIVLAARKNCARYCLPRIVMICGLTVCSIIVVIFMATYLAGSSASVNTSLFKVYEYFFDEKLTDVEKSELKHQLLYYGIAFFVLAGVFLTYNLFELWLTIKFKATLNDFEAVPTEATAPQHSYNPDYAEPPLKVYKNMA